MTDFISAIVAGYLRDVNLRDAAGRSGRVLVNVEVCLDRGEIPWTTGSVHFVERKNYP